MMNYIEFVKRPFFNEEWSHTYVFRLVGKSITPAYPRLEVLSPGCMLDHLWGSWYTRMPRSNLCQSDQSIWGWEPRHGYWKTCVPHGSKVDSGLRTTALDDCLPSPTSSVFYYMRSVSLKLYIFPILFSTKILTFIHWLNTAAAERKDNSLFISCKRGRRENTEEDQWEACQGSSGHLPCQPCPCRHEWCPGWMSPRVARAMQFLSCLLAQIIFYIQGKGVFPESSNGTTSSLSKSVFWL